MLTVICFRCRRSRIRHRIYCAAKKERKAQMELDKCRRETEQSVVEDNDDKDTEENPSKCSAEVHGISCVFSTKNVDTFQS